MAVWQALKTIKSVFSNPKSAASAILKVSLLADKIVFIRTYAVPPYIVYF